MHFPNAFKKVFVSAVDGSPLAVDLATTGSTQNLTAGQIGLFKKDYTVITAAPVSVTPFFIAQGSYYSSDTLGTHGGYQESSKSKLIDPKYVHRFWKSTSVTAVNQVIAVGWDTKTSGSNDATHSFECGKTYNLRLDVKGEAALRFLNRNLYHTFDAYTGCCAAGCSAGCTGDLVDPTTVYLAWKDQITQDPIMSKLIRAKVYYKNTATSPVVAKTEALSAYDVELAGSGTAYVPYTVEAEIAGVIAGIQIEVIYSPTTFGNATFSPRDHYELEPTRLYASIVDETGNPCGNPPQANSSSSDMVTELTEGRQATGVGETVLRDYLLSESYAQNWFGDGSIDQLRKREVEGGNQLTVVNRTGRYDRICILHSVPRRANPSGTMDNDQYLLEIVVPTGTSTTAFTDLIQDLLDLAGNGVTLETL